MNLQKAKECSFRSLRQTPESRKNKTSWTPAFNGVTALRAFYETFNVGADKPETPYQ
jgi:hypothetical protein